MVFNQKDGEVDCLLLQDRDGQWLTLLLLIIFPIADIRERGISTIRKILSIIMGDSL